MDSQLDLHEDTLQEDEERFDLSEQDKAFLLESLEQARRGEGVDGWNFLQELHTRRAPS